MARPLPLPFRRLVEFLHVDTLALGKDHTVSASRRTFTVRSGPPLSKRRRTRHHVDRFGRRLFIIPDTASFRRLPNATRVRPGSLRLRQSHRLLELTLGFMLPRFASQLFSCQVLAQTEVFPSELMQA